MKTAVIFGAGPAGLTAAYELLKKTDIRPIIYEIESQVGGISKTVHYKGNRIDLGPHRFFSKNQAVKDLWLTLLPLETRVERNNLASFRVVDRLTRIFFKQKFFDYPLKINISLFKNLGIVRLAHIALSYIFVILFPIKKAQNLEEFYINRFGKALYLLFFKDYTKKVWGIPCDEIPPDWGAQRVKGLSIRKVLEHAVVGLFSKEKGRKAETSLIEQFMFPKLGAGQLYEKMAEEVVKMGGEIVLGKRVIHLKHENNIIQSVEIKDVSTNESKIVKGDYFFSSMPITGLVKGMGDSIPIPVKEVGANLIYRDYIQVGILLKKMKINLKDNWIYIQDPGVQIGRLDVFNNFSLEMIENPKNIWVGAEYFCSIGDNIWERTDDSIRSLAITELEKIKLISREDVIDSVVIRVPKAYPAYFGSYKDFHVLRNYFDSFPNLFLIGRNGMHRYNNMDHSILTAKEAVANIIREKDDKSNIWDVNTEDDYHEETT